MISETKFEKIVSLKGINLRTSIYIRYEEQHPGDKPAHLTKDLDKFDMIMQAMEYEEKSKKGDFLQDFFDSTKNVICHEQVQSWDQKLRENRQKLHNDST